MNNFNAKTVIRTAVSATILASGASGAGARMEPAPGKAVAALTTMRLIESVDAYCFRWEGSSGDHQKLLCDINPDLHVPRAQMETRLKRRGIRLLDWNRVYEPKWPRHFVRVSIKTVSRRSKRRARVTISLDADLDDQIIAESIGTMYLDYRHGRWIVNEHDSRIQTGE